MRRACKRSFFCLDVGDRGRGSPGTTRLEKLAEDVLGENAVGILWEVRGEEVCGRLKGGLESSTSCEFLVRVVLGDCLRWCCFERLWDGEKYVCSSMSFLSEACSHSIFPTV